MAEDETNGEQDEQDEHGEQDDDAELEPAQARARIEGLRAEAADWRRRLRKVEEERDEARAAQQSESERALSDAERKGAEAERTKWTRRLLEADLRTAAAGVLRDPQDAVRYVDLGELLELEEDARDLPKRIKALVEEKPYLAAGGEGDGEQKNGRQGARSQGVRSQGRQAPAQSDSDWLRQAARRR